MESVLALATVLGPILLLAVLVWAWLRTRRASRSNEIQAERGARDLRQDIEDRPQKDVDL
ncbi:MAG: hypothetical protein KKE77_10545 [Alphaproteobacteria bacterium]|jgi:cbb3-type cytochrome oxidase subunit 3|nr:hypothetical protein [Alphaproteobacteria bacterium]